MKDNGQFSKAYLTENGIPIIIMSYVNLNKSFYYSLETKCWHLIPIGPDPIQILTNSSSIFGNNLRRVDPMDKSGPLELVQSKLKSTKLVKSLVYRKITQQIYMSLILTLDY